MNSVEKYDFNIIDVIKTSFKMTDGFKGKFWASFGVMIAIMFLFNRVFDEIVAILEIGPEMAENIGGIIVLPIAAPIATGLFMMSANYTRGESVGYKNIFDYFGSMWKLLGVYLLTILIIFVPIVLFLFPATSRMESGSELLMSIAALALMLSVLVATISYMFSLPIFVPLVLFSAISRMESGSELLMFMVALALILSVLIAKVSYMFTPQLLVDKNLSIWQSMELSRKATWQHLFKIVGLFLLFTVILLISAISIIGLIWTMPATYIGTYGLLYRIMFDGVELDSSK